VRSSYPSDTCNRIRYLCTNSHCCGVSVVDPHHIDADPDSTYHPDADPDVNPDSDLFDADADPSFKILGPWKSAQIGSSYGI
jgi:hypothetical protein